MVPAESRTTPGDGLEQRALAGAVGADDGDDLALGHGQIEAVEDLDPPVAGADVAAVQARRSPRLLDQHPGAALDLHHDHVVGRQTVVVGRGVVVDAVRSRRSPAWRSSAAWMAAGVGAARAVSMASTSRVTASNA